MDTYYYHDQISVFLSSPENEIIGELITSDAGLTIQQTQVFAWRGQISILKDVLKPFEGDIFFEYAIPRMGRRIDAVLIISNVLFILEFKVGEREFLNSAIDQVWDYALDLKNFHEASHDLTIAPIIIATEAEFSDITIEFDQHDDKVYVPIRANRDNLFKIIRILLEQSADKVIEPTRWVKGRYSPTPTIIEAAMALYNNHSVADITRSDATATNLSTTSNAIKSIIEESKKKKQKAICFVTGVPGAGKTLVGLDIATKNLGYKNNTSSVFLSGNGPLVAVLREALARDSIRRKKEIGESITKGEALREVKVFIQNVHHFRDAYLSDSKAPYDHIAIFDEAQRAWDLHQTMSFMKQKKNVPNFAYSEPEFLISCLDRHDDWAVIICLVGGGQEIHKGEAGISEWIYALNRSFPEWKLYMSSKITDSEYAAGEAINLARDHHHFHFHDDLHLAVSLRSFRAEKLSALVKAILDRNTEEAKQLYRDIKDNYPIVITRDIQEARKWLKENARGTERCGLVVSSQAYRLRPLAIDVRTSVNPIHYFLNEKRDIRSSYFLEDAATEFQIQGLELDWVGVVWDADFRYSPKGWGCHSFKGEKWQNIHKEERKQYLKNAYRVLLTRARQGMVIVVPHGNNADPTRNPRFYDSTYNYLKQVGLKSI